MSGSSSGNVPSWLLKAKVMTPELVRDYLQRSSLLRKIESGLERRLTVLQAPAGFGKTTVLADVARRKQAEGVLVGWLSLDEDDTPSVVGNCLASAFEHASLDLTESQDLDAWSSSPSVHQIGMLARAIELHSAPCLLVLDEVDRLPPRSVELVDRPDQTGPRQSARGRGLPFQPGSRPRHACPERLGQRCQYGAVPLFGSGYRSVFLRRTVTPRADRSRGADGRVARSGDGAPERARQRGGGFCGGTPSDLPPTTLPFVFFATCRRKYGPI